MNAVTIWHNPRCGKSRATLELLKERGLTPEVRLYLDAPPDADELRAVLAMLHRPAADLVRWKEAEKPDGLTPEASEEALIAALVAHPKLIERPVVIYDGRAQIGRPPEAVLDIL